VAYKTEENMYAVTKLREDSVLAERRPGERRMREREREEEREIWAE